VHIGERFLQMMMPFICSTLTTLLPLLAPELDVIQVQGLFVEGTAVGTAEYIWQVQHNMQGRQYYASALTSSLGTNSSNSA
jgi:hypothetical protein